MYIRERAALRAMYNKGGDEKINLYIILEKIRSPTGDLYLYGDVPPCDVYIHHHAWR
jgi:hypothetical protein